MTRETRINLIFIVVLVVLLLPGGIMLFRAKLDPNARRMFKPDVIRPDSVYINYDDHRPSTPRIVPPLTGQWVQQQAQRLLHPDVRPRLYWLKGIASENYRFELAAMASSAETGSFLAVLTWDPKMVEPVFTIDGQPVTLINHFTIEVAPKVREELQNEGFVQPPSHVQAYLFQSPGDVQGKLLSATFANSQGTKLEERMTLPRIINQDDSASPSGTSDR